MAMCRATITHKYRQKPCRLFIVLGGSLVLLGMQDVKTLELLSVNCKTTQPCKQLNEQTTHDKPGINRHLKGDVTINGKCNNNISYSLAGTDTNVEIKESA